jgi:hypothetical protein
VLVGFALEYNTAMNATSADLTANYQVTSEVIRRGRRKHVTLSQPVFLTAASYAPDGWVTLFVQGKPTFKNGGEIQVIDATPGGVISEAGVPLAASSSRFTILAKATNIQPG